MARAYLKSDGHWNVCNTNSTPKRQLWHKVVGFDSGTKRIADTKCGLAFDFPTPNTVFTENLGECMPQKLCQDGCYNG